MEGGLVVTTIAVYPGTFDPVTYGHINILKRAAKIFDKVIMAVAADNYKNTIFSVEERLSLIQQCCQKGCLKDIPNIEVDIFHGLLINYLEEKKAVAIIRGLRAISDFEYEMQMAAINKHLNCKVETVFLMTAAEYSFVSSSIIKSVAMMGGDVDKFVPPVVVDALKDKYKVGD